MAAGLPVVAARAGGLAEIVPDEGLYPPGDVEALAGRCGALWRATPRRVSARSRSPANVSPPAVVAAAALR